jgi:hypothetical protein
MKRIIGLFTACLVFFPAAGSRARAENNIWSSGTALTLPKGRWELGVFQPVRYGLNESMELSSHALTFFVMPNIDLKKAWPGFWGVKFATLHGLTYPTLLLNLISKKGTGGILPADTEVPQILAVHNKFLLTKTASDWLVLTLKGGASFALTGGGGNLPTIDLPIVFPRTSAYYHHASFILGLDAGGVLYKRFEYLADMDHFILLDEKEPYIFEHKTMILWKKSKRFLICAGYKLVYPAYPYVKEKEARLMPLVDVQWGIR